MKNSSRRTFVKNSLGITAGALFFSQAKAMDFLATESTAALNFDFVKLPYAFNALEPSIDAETMQIHYERHYSAYVKNANEAIQEEGIKAANPKALFAEISKYSKKIRNNGGGAFNHEMFWSILQKPTANNTPKGKLLAAITKDFGSLDAFKDQFGKAATGQFGSGWAWLVADGGKLKIGSTPNQDNPLMDVSTFKGTPLLCLDVWEHAYYLKYQNKRADYIKNWWDIVNWDQVSTRFGA